MKLIAGAHSRCDCLSLASDTLLDQGFHHSLNLFISDTVMNLTADWKLILFCTKVKLGIIVPPRHPF